MSACLSSYLVDGDDGYAVRQSKELWHLSHLAGFALASMSAVVAIGAGLYSVTTGGFLYYAPSLLMIYRIGLLLSLGGLAFGLGGVWKRNPLRWHAPALSIGMLLLWLFWASGE
jgi:hypothetical protein